MSAPSFKGRAAGDGNGVALRFRPAPAGATVSGTGAHAGAHAASQVASNGLSVDEALKKIALEKARREKNEKFVDEQIGSLQKYQDNVVSRWSSTNDFDKVDLVCAELLKNDNFTAAVQYMERVRTLVDSILLKLLPKAIQEGYEPSDQVPYGGMGSPPTMKRAVTNTGYISGSKETLSPATAVPPMGLMPPNRRDEEELKATKMRLDQAISKAKQMEIQLSDAKNRLAALEKKYKEERTQLDKREADQATTASRQATKAAELQTMLGVVERGKRTEAELVERNQRLQAELLATQDQVKWLERTGSTMRVKLQSAEDALKKERKDDAMAGIKMEMAAEELSSAENDLKAEKRNNLKALKAKNKEIDVLKTRVRELESQLGDTQEALKKAEEEGKKGKKIGEEYAKPMVYSAEVGRPKASARAKATGARSKGPTSKQAAKSGVVEVQFGNGATPDTAEAEQGADATN